MLRQCATAKVMVTGANGFVGSALIDRINLHRDIEVLGVVRDAARAKNLAFPFFEVGSIDGDTCWESALNGVDFVIHTAARAHVLKDSSSDPLIDFRKVNVAGTLNLANQAAKSGVKRFVFVSSIGVMGAETFQTPFCSTDLCSPHSPYAVSKYEAEVLLMELALKSDMEVVIVRPPLVHGANAPGNFDLLLRWLCNGVPLPFGSVVNNRRSLVGIDNLVDFLLLCIKHPDAVNKIFLVSDGEDISTADLLFRLSAALGKPIRLLPVPVRVLKLCFRLFGKAQLEQSLLSNLQLDISHSTKILGWKPSVSLDDGLKRAVFGFLLNK